MKELEEAKWSGIAQKDNTTNNVIVIRCHVSDII
jgi:hypothetical protein